MTKAFCLYHSVLKVPLEDCPFSPDLKKNRKSSRLVVSTSAMLASYKPHQRKNFPKTWNWDDLCTIFERSQIIYSIRRERK